MHSVIFCSTGNSQSLSCYTTRLEALLCNCRVKSSCTRNEWCCQILWPFTQSRNDYPATKKSEIKNNVSRMVASCGGFPGTWLFLKATLPQMTLKGGGGGGGGKVLLRGGAPLDDSHFARLDQMKEGNFHPIPPAPSVDVSTAWWEPGWHLCPASFSPPSTVSDVFE